MKQFFLSIMLLACASTGFSDNDCSARLSDLGLPLQVKTSGKPRTAKWGRVNKIMGEYLIESDVLQGCQLFFENVFSPAREDAYFPVLYNLLRTVPEDSLKGAEVYAQDGKLLGHFSNIVVFEKRGSSNIDAYYFQFLDETGILQPAGRDSLIDIPRVKPRFLMKWKDIKGRILLSEKFVGE